MSKTLNDLWNGNLNPSETAWEKNEEAKKYEQEMFNCYEELDKSIDDTSKELLIKYSEAVNIYTSSLEEEAFVSGFALAVKIMAESLNKF